MTAPSYVSKSQALSPSGSVSSITASAPSGSGGMLLAIVFAIRVADIITISTPSGWTLVNQTVSGSALVVGMFVRFNDTGTPWTWNFDFTTSQGAQAHILRYSGVDSSDPVDTLSLANNEGREDGVVTVPSLTTNYRDSLIVCGMPQRRRSLTLSLPDGFSERVNVTNPTGTDPNGTTVVIGDKAQVPAGASGEFLISTNGVDTPDRFLGFALALKSASPSVNNSHYYHQQQRAAI